MPPLCWLIGRREQRQEALAEYYYKPYRIIEALNGRSTPSIVSQLYQFQVEDSNSPVFADNERIEPTSNEEQQEEWRQIQLMTGKWLQYANLLTFSASQRLLADCKTVDSYLKQLVTMEREIFPWLSGLNITGDDQQSKGLNLVPNDDAYDDYNINYDSVRRDSNQWVDRAVLIGTANPFVRLTIINIRYLRETLRSSIPIHLFYIDDQDLSPYNQRRLQQISTGIRLFSVRDLLGTQSVDTVKPKGFSIKPFILLLGQCKECILMDADSFMLVPPMYIFDHVEEYRQHGVLFFHDRLLPQSEKTTGRDMFSRFREAQSLALASRLSRNSPLISEWQYNYEPVRRFMRGESSELQESGVVVFDKRKPRNIAALLVACSMNSMPLREMVYNASYGDKETYWMSMELVGARYSFSGMFPGNMGLMKGGWWSLWRGVCGGNMLHLVRSQPDLPLWFNGGLTHNKYCGSAPDHNQTARWDSWVTGGVWHIDPLDYCLGGWRIVGGIGEMKQRSEIRWIEVEMRRVLDSLMSIASVVVD